MVGPGSDVHGVSWDAITTFRNSKVSADVPSYASLHQVTDAVHKF